MKSQTNGVVPISTFETTFDSLLSVYTLDSDSQLVLIGEDDDSSYDDDAVVHLNTIAGTTYFIAVDGFDGAEGAITLHVGNPYYSFGSRTSSISRPGPALRLKGIRDEMFVLQVSTNMGDWKNVSTNQFTNSTFAIPEPDPGSPMLFYRAVPVATRNPAK